MILVELRLLATTVMMMPLLSITTKLDCEFLFLCAVLHHEYMRSEAGDLSWKPVCGGGGRKTIKLKIALVD